MKSVVCFEKSLLIGRNALRTCEKAISLLWLTVPIFEAEFLMKKTVSKSQYVYNNRVFQTPGQFGYNITVASTLTFAFSGMHEWKLVTSDTFCFCYLLSPPICFLLLLILNLVNRCFELNRIEDAYTRTVVKFCFAWNGLPFKLCFYWYFSKSREN